MAQLPRTPDIQAQRAAMQELAFLVGTWAGEGRLHRAPGEPLVVTQTEEAQYRLDGLILSIEGVGRSKDGTAVLQAFGVISYDDEVRAYRMRAFNDGRFLETEVQLSKHGPGLQWGFALGDVRTSSILRINEKGEWTEHAEIRISGQPPKTLLELTLRRLE